MSTRFTPAQRRSGRKRKAVNPNGDPLSKEEEARREKLLQKVMEQLKPDILKLLHKLMTSELAEFFLEPVDAVKLNVPTYYEVIKDPMDFSTVKNKVQQRLYGSVDEFVDDVRLIFTNCLAFNAAGSEICFMAAALSKMFETDMDNIRDKEIDYIEEAEMLELKQTMSQLFEEQTKMFQELEKLRNEPHNPNNSYIPPPQPVYTKKQTKQAKKNKKKKNIIGGNLSTRKTPNFTKKRKQELTGKINGLDQTQLEKVVEILDLGKQEGEVEIDLDKLPNATLYKLELFVNDTLNIPKSSSSRGSLHEDHESSVSPKNDDSFSSSSDESNGDVDVTGH